MRGRRLFVVVVAAILCGAAVDALLVASDHQDDKAVWAVFGPAVGWSFIATGLYATHRRPESRTGVLMVYLGFAWFLGGLTFANSALLHSLSLVLGACGAPCSCTW